MKLRPIQLVCLALLLSTLRLTDPSVLTPASFSLQSSYLRALLNQDYDEVWNSQRPTSQDHTDDTVSRTGHIPAIFTTRKPPITLAPEHAALTKTVWTMRPPSAQCAALQSVTGFGRTRA
jgi:hypothetical protein